MGIIRALAVDIDGTLSDQNRVLCPAALQALRGLKVPVVLSTGNSHCFTRAVCVLLGTPHIFIAENGGVLSYSEDEMQILADLKVCEDAFQKLSAEFPLQRYSSSRYRFTDIALKRNFDVLAADRRAQELGLPDFIVWRHPFPGPGLAIRVIGEITDPRLEILRQADKIVQQELLASDWYRKVWQGFAVLLPLKTVGVMGDDRTYEHVIALRIVDSIDAMTADWSRVPSEILARMSSRIINEVKGVNRVVLDISSKPPSTIEWE